MGIKLSKFSLKNTFFKKKSLVISKLLSVTLTRFVIVRNNLKFVTPVKLFDIVVYYELFHIYVSITEEKDILYLMKTTFRVNTVFVKVVPQTNILYLKINFVQSFIVEL